MPLSAAMQAGDRMGDDEQELRRWRRLPVLCERCGAREVIAVRGADRVLVYCEACGERILAYYAGRDHQRGGVPPADEDAQLIREVERGLLEQVSRPAAALYEYIRRYVRRYGYAPTLREMQIACGWRSQNTARHHLLKLVEVGLVERDYGETRGLRLPHVA